MARSWIHVESHCYKEAKVSMTIEVAGERAADS
jgi:hypothetical protein